MGLSKESIIGLINDLIIFDEVVNHIIAKYYSFLKKGSYLLF
jgi:hypothetical protein